MNTDRKYRLRFKHKDFICKQLSLFKPHKQVARDLLAQFPKLPLSFDEALTRVRYYAANNRTDKWRNRIIEYRRMMEYHFPDRFRLANKHQRIMELERIFAHAMKPKIRKVIWFPIKKTPKGDILYSHKEVHQRDLRTAVSVLGIIASQLDELCLGPYPSHLHPENSLSYDQIVERMRKHLKNLDIRFGIK